MRAVQRRMNTGTDAALLDRVLWRDQLSPDTLISRDCGLIARAYGSIFIFGATVAAVGLLVSEATADRDWLILLLAAIAIGLGVVCFVAYTRLPAWYFTALNLMGTALITVASTATTHGAEGVYAVFYIWMAVLAGLFCGPRRAAALITIPVVCFAAVLYAREVEFAGYYTLTLAAVTGTTGLIIGRLRDRIEHLAVGMASDARTDALTALPNRRAFDERYELESGRFERDGIPFSVAICDLDGFKEVNDRFGHQEGDEALKRSARAIEGAVRAVDAVARMGGEEFGVILPGADRDEAHQVGERIREAIRREFFEDEVPLTISSGIATVGRDGKGRALLRVADTALYQAKERGRNRTVSFEGPDGTPGQSVSDSSTK